MSEQSVDVLVVGAGMAGLTAAREIQKAGRTVQVVEQGPTVGGRLATSRLGKALADHGAQFFTARTPEFQATIERWQHLGVAFLWSLGWSTGSFGGNDDHGHPRYAAHGGMKKLAQFLARGLEIDCNVRLTTLEQTDGAWLATSDERERYRAQALLLTPPVPQALALLDTGQVTLAADDRAGLERIHYAPCLAGLFHIDRQTLIPAPGAVQRPAESIPWIADNRKKGISPDETVVTLHGDPAYSRRYWDAPEMEVLENMRGVLRRYLPPGAQVLEAQLKRWPYAAPEVLHPERALRCQGEPLLVFAGDAFGGPRVEGAHLSGLAAAAEILGGDP